MLYSIFFCTIFITVSGLPNFVIIVTDDQDVVLKGMTPMEKTMELLGKEGVTVSNAFTPSPLCCPARASFLTGMYAHNHATINNSVSGGCYGSFWKEKVEPVHTLPVFLKTAGYSTFYAGKYLNKYETNSVPVGWDRWYGLHGNSKYYNYTLSKNGEIKDYTDIYFTDLLQNLTLNFISQQTETSSPFLAIISPPAPHEPATPAPRHEGKFKDRAAPRTPNFNTANDNLNKPWLLRMPPQALLENAIENIDSLFRKRWESLLAVDELVEATVQALENVNKLAETYIIYTSDNGYHLGQFGQAFDKRLPYETDIRVPLIIRGPTIPRNQKIKFPVGLHDLTPTILDLAGINVPSFIDGMSVRKHLEMTHSSTDHSEFERVILIEHWGEGNEHTFNPECDWEINDFLYGCTKEADCRCQDSRNNTYACLRHISSRSNKIYCEYNDDENFAEAYDLDADEFQLENKGYSWLPTIRAKYSLLLQQMRGCIGNDCK